MASGAQALQFSFGGGIDEGTRDELNEPGAWAVLENIRQDARGAASKRYGFTALGTLRYDGTSPTAGYKLAADRDTIVRVVDGIAEVYSATSGRWRSLGRVPACASRIVDTPNIGKSSSYMIDADYVNGYFAVSWFGVTDQDAIAAVFDANGSFVRVPEVIDSSSVSAVPYLTVVGNYLILVRAITATDIKAWYLDTTSATTLETGWVAFGALLANDGSSTYILHSLGAKAAIAYVNNSAGTSRLTVKTFDTSGVLQTQTVNTSSVTPSVTSLAGSISDTLWVAWNEGVDVKVRGLDPTSITATALATTDTVLTTVADVPGVIGIAAGSTAGTARLFANDESLTHIHYAGITTSGGAAVGGTEYITSGAVGAGRPYQLGGRYYVPVVCDEDNSQNTLVIVDWTENENYLRPIANPAPSLSAPNLAGTQKIFAGASSTKLYTPLSIKRNGVADGTSLLELDFAATSTGLTARHGGSLYFSGALLHYSDGARVAEAGFMFRPLAPEISTSGTGITGTFSYVWVIEEVDGDGNWHISGVSDPTSSGSVTNKTITVNTTPTCVTSRRFPAGKDVSPLRYALYRTVTGAEPPYYRVATVTNDPTASVVYNDTTADATLIANPKLYSQPSVDGTAKDRRAPAGLNVIAEYNGMVVGGAGSDLWYSGQPISGEGAWFNPIFVVPFPEDITGLASQDGALIVFSRRSIHIVAGGPPSDNGSSDLMGTPRRLSSDVGCIDPRSICVTSLGVFFQSERGIEVLTRGQQVEWVGESVQTTLAAYPIITSATIDPVSSTVLIECAASEAAGLVSGNGRTLVYDLALRTWTSTDIRLTSDGVPAQSGCIVYTSSGYRYAWIRANGTVYYEDRTTHLDASAWVSMRAISPWIKAAGLQGPQMVSRATLLAKRSTHHDVNVSFAYDYASTYKTTRLYTATQLNTLVSALPNMQLDHPLHDDAQPCESVRIRISDATPSTGQAVTTGQGGTWIGLAFEVVPKTGTYKLPDESR
jgi:hypothetical protein